MKALTLWQPWAALMAIGSKRIETRGWETDYRGPLAICSSKDTPKEGRRSLQDAKIVHALQTDPDIWTYLVNGSCLCLVDLVDVVHVETLTTLTPDEKHFGDYRRGRFAWVTRPIARLNRPMPVKGRQLLWELDGVCRVCGCWENAACNPPCHWIEPDLCSACETNLQSGEREGALTIHGKDR